MKGNKVGFTLIELLVVVLIIGILAAIALPQYNKAVERSRMAEAMQRLGDYASAQQVYYMHNNGFASAYSTLNQGDIKVPEQTEVGNWDTSDSRWSVASASGSSLEKVTMSALRTGGIFKDCVLTLSVEANGKITKTCSGNDDCCTTAQNGGYETVVPVNSRWSSAEDANDAGYNALLSWVYFNENQQWKDHGNNYSPGYCSSMHFASAEEAYAAWANEQLSGISQYDTGLNCTVEWSCDYARLNDGDGYWAEFIAGVSQQLYDKYHDDFVDTWSPNY